MLIRKHSRPHLDVAIMVLTLLVHGSQHVSIEPARIAPKLVLVHSKHALVVTLGYQWFLNRRVDGIVVDRKKPVPPPPLELALDKQGTICLC